MSESFNTITTPNVKLTNFELDMARKISGNSYMEYYPTDGSNVTNVDYWTDNTKGTKLFSKVITWNGSNPSVVTITDEITHKILTTTIGYSGSTIINVTKVIS